MPAVSSSLCPLVWILLEDFLHVEPVPGSERCLDHAVLQHDPVRIDTDFVGNQRGGLVSPAERAREHRPGTASVEDTGKRPVPSRRPGTPRAGSGGCPAGPADGGRGSRWSRAVTQQVDRHCPDLSTRNDVDAVAVQAMDRILRSVEGVGFASGRARDAARGGSCSPLRGSPPRGVRLPRPRSRAGAGPGPGPSGCFPPLGCLKFQGSRRRCSASCG